VRASNALPIQALHLVAAPPLEDAILPTRRTVVGNPRRAARKPSARPAGCHRRVHLAALPIAVIPRQIKVLRHSGKQARLARNLLMQEPRSGLDASDVLRARTSGDSSPPEPRVINQALSPERHPRLLWALGGPDRIRPLGRQVAFRGDCRFGQRFLSRLRFRRWRRGD